MAASTGPHTVYGKTDKGNLEIRERTVKLPREAGLVFLSIDGKATFSELLPRSGMSAGELEQTLQSLVTDGYIEPLRVGGARANGVPKTGVEVESDPADKLSAEAAGHAARETEAAKRAREAARAALDARMRQESEARARLLAEARAQAEAEARGKAEAAARAALDDQARAQAEAKAASDPGERARAEARALAAAGVAARAEAEARARAESAERAKALVNAKRAAEQQARDEADATARAEMQAQAEAADAARSRNAAEAQLAVISATRADTATDEHAASSPFGARKPAIIPDIDVSARARELTARVQAERRAREQAERKAREDVLLEGGGRSGTKPADESFPRLELGNDGAKEQALSVDASELADPMVKHAPTALERAMAQQAKIARAREKTETESAAIPVSKNPAKATAAVIAVPALDREPTAREKADADDKRSQAIAPRIEPHKRPDAAETGHGTGVERETRARDQAKRAGAARRTKSRRHWATGAGFMAVALGAIGIAGLQFAPLDAYVKEAQNALSERLKEPVRISSVRYVLLPTPRIVLDGITIGKEAAIRAERIEAHASPFAVMSEPLRFSRVEAMNIAIDPAMLATIPSWTGGRSASAFHVSRLQLSNLKLNLPGSEVAPLEGEVIFEPNGTVREALLTNEKLKVRLAPKDGATVFKVDANAWTAPVGPPLAFSYFNASGVLKDGQIAMNEFSGRIASGYIHATGVAQWAGPLTIEGTFSLRNVRLEELLPALTDNLEAKGALNAQGRYAMRAARPDELLASTRVEADFSATRGELTHLDLLRGFQSPGINGSRGGRTLFDEVTGTLQATSNGYAYRQLRLSSGPLRAGGILDVARGGKLSGRFNAELVVGTGLAARSAFDVSGTVKEPLLRR